MGYNKPLYKITSPRNPRESRPQGGIEQNGDTTNKMEVIQATAIDPMFRIFLISCPTEIDSVRFF